MIIIQIWFIYQNYRFEVKQSNNLIIVFLSQLLFETSNMITIDSKIKLVHWMFN